METHKQRKRIFSKKGETLIETLVGVLIVAMASTIIFAGVAASVRVNKEAQEKRNVEYDVHDNPSGELRISGVAETIPVIEHIYTEKEDPAKVGYVWFELPTTP